MSNVSDIESVSKSSSEMNTGDNISQNQTLDKILARNGNNLGRPATTHDIVDISLSIERLATRLEECMKEIRELQGAKNTRRPAAAKKITESEPGSTSVGKSIKASRPRYLSNITSYFTEKYKNDPEFRERYENDAIKKIIEADENIKKKKGDNKVAAARKVVWDQLKKTGNEKLMNLLMKEYETDKFKFDSSNEPKICEPEQDTDDEEEEEEKPKPTKTKRTAQKSQPAKRTAKSVKKDKDDEIISDESSENENEEDEKARGKRKPAARTPAKNTAKNSRAKKSDASD